MQAYFNMAYFRSVILKLFVRTVCYKKDWSVSWRTQPPWWTHPLLYAYRNREATCNIVPSCLSQYVGSGMIIARKGVRIYWDSLMQPLTGMGESHKYCQCPESSSVSLGLDWLGKGGLCILCTDSWHRTADKVFDSIWWIPWIHTLSQSKQLKEES